MASSLNVCLSSRCDLLFLDQKVEPRVELRHLVILKDYHSQTPNGQHMFAEMLRIVPRKVVSVSCKRNTMKISKRMVHGECKPHINEKEFAGQSVLYKVENKVAHITLNRPERYNAIDENTPVELERAVQLANMDDDVKLIVLSGKKVFCSGYDLKKFAEAERGSQPGSQKMPWDPYIDYKFMARCNDAWMSLWKSLKPTIAKINGVAIGGGSDMALVCDITIATNDTLIGYPPSRVWGCPTSAMWFYRVGMERAKRILFTGEILTGEQAAQIGLIGEAVPSEELDATVDKMIKRMITVPTNQLFFQKQVINNAVEQMGIFQTQRLATLFDGMSRHTPEGVAFQERVHKVGFKKAVQERDDGIEAVWSDVGKSKL